jgi:hypothetical protein
MHSNAFSHSRYLLQNNGHSWSNDQNYPSIVAHQTIFLGGRDGSAIVLPEVVGVAGQ